jgi:hypothetical protein
MREIPLSEYVAQARAFLHVDRGLRARRELMYGRGWPFDRFVAEVVIQETHLEVYEKISAVTDQVIIEELRPESARVGA